MAKLYFLYTHLFRSVFMFFFKCFVHVFSCSQGFFYFVLLFLLHVLCVCAFSFLDMFLNMISGRGGGEEGTVFSNKNNYFHMFTLFVFPFLFHFYHFSFFFHFHFFNI